MNQDDKGWFSTRFARLPTGLKMFLIISFWLFPLGLVAILASVETAQRNNADRAEQTIARLGTKAQRIDALLSQSVSTIRAASAAISLTAPRSGVCEDTLQRLARAQRVGGRYALYGNGVLRCSSPGYSPMALLPDPGNRRSAIDINADGQVLRFALFDDRGRIEGVGEFTRESLAALTLLPGNSPNFDLLLFRGDRKMMLRDNFKDGPLVQRLHATRPAAGGRLHLAITLGAPPLAAPELLMILLPVLMWIAAAVIGWAVTDRLLLKPLARMQRAVSAYAPGDRRLDLPAHHSPAPEIGALGRAFDEVTQTIARHEAELEAAVERQTRLVREVHHRVKNNLQVVASLLNLHARGATSEDVAAAYASIQRRVDALAVVHRNHYAELEENRGVALRPLISELAANLRATAPATASSMAVRIDIEPFYVTQDVAVSVAFLITEVVEFAMFCGGRSVAISLSDQSGTTARLSIESESLLTGVACDPKLFERFDRIVTGLSRQLRSAIERDGEAGRYALPIAIIDKAEAF